MASASPKSATDAQPYLKASFKISKVCYDVSLSETTLSWLKTGVDTTKTETVKIEEILFAEVVSSTGASSSVSGFDLGYMKHKKNNVRRHKVLRFNGSSSEAETWCRKIQEAVNKIPGRPRRVLVLVNPVSGSSKGRQIYKKYAAEIFRMAHIETDVIVTERAHHTEEILSNYDLKSVDALVLVGGDGIYHEAVNGLQLRWIRESGLDKNDSTIDLQPLPLPIGIIPAGTGNGIVAGCNGTYDIESAVLTIIVGNTLPSNLIAVYCCGELVAFSSLLVGYGYWGDMIYRCEKRRYLGKLRYPVGIIESIFIRSFRETEIIIDYLPPTTSAQGQSGQPDYTESSLVESQWKRCQGVFIGEFLFLDDVLGLYKGKEKRGLPLMVNKPMTRRQMFGFFKKMVTFDETLMDSDCIVHLEVKDYKVKLVHPSTEGSEASKFEHALNIDGECFPLKQPEFLVRTHLKTVQLFSRGKYMGFLKKTREEIEQNSVDTRNFALVTH